MTETQTEPTTKRRLGVMDGVKLAVFGALAVVLVVAVDQWDLRALRDPAVLETRVADFGPWLYPAYFGLWLLLQVAIGQTVIPTVAGGILFGWFAGGFIAVIGAVFSTTAHLLLVRTLLRAPAERFILSRFRHIQQGIESRGLGLLILMRFLWMPSSLITLGTAVTRIPVRVHVAAVPFMLPQAFLWTLATESIYRYGWDGIPTERWFCFALITVSSS